MSKLNLFIWSSHLKSIFYINTPVLIILFGIKLLIDLYWKFNIYSIWIDWNFSFDILSSISFSFKLWIFWIGFSGISFSKLFSLLLFLFFLLLLLLFLFDWIHRSVLHYYYFLGYQYLIIIFIYFLYEYIIYFVIDFNSSKENNHQKTFKKKEEFIPIILK